MEVGMSKERKAREFVGERLREVRERKGLSQDAAGTAAGLSANFVGSLERGEKAPSLETLVALASVYRVDVADFVTGLTGSGVPSDPLERLVNAAEQIKQAAGELQRRNARRPRGGSKSRR